MTEAAPVLQGLVWSSGPFEHIADGAGPAHDALVAALGPRVGERWLDVATGTGPVAIRAALSGADVTGVDVAPRMLATAARRAAEAGVRVRFEAGEAERLPYADAVFDVVSSAQGVVFALDATAAAGELARVCRQGGRLGLTCPVAAGISADLALRVGAGGPALAWGDARFVRELLGRAFDLTFARGDAPLEASSAEAATRLYVRCYPPLRFFWDRLDRSERARLERELTALFSRYAHRGRVHAPRPYLVVLGRRRSITSTNACD